MFDGADLSLVYGNSFDPMPQQMMQPQAPPAPPAVQSITDAMAAPAATSHATAPDMPYSPPSAMYASQGPAAPTPHVPSFWDRIGERKWEVLKLVVLAFVVLLGISMDRVATHYLNNYISKAFLTDMQELLVRLSYPIIIILILWIIKASV